MEHGITCVYMIENCVNKKVYIGSTRDLKSRMNRHLSLLRNGRHDSKILQKDWEIFGESSFKLYLLDITVVDDDDILKDMEQLYLDKYNSSNDKFGYNLYPNSRTPIGYSHSEETKKKLSNLKIGNNNHFYGKSHREESKDKISESRAGKYKGEENPFSKFTEDVVIEILQHLKNKTMSWRKIAETYGISNSQISRIRKGEQWGYLKEKRSDLYE